MPKVWIKAATAEAIQLRALGSMLLLRKPAFMSLAETYPSWTVYWPEPIMPMPVGPMA